MKVDRLVRWFLTTPKIILAVLPLGKHWNSILERGAQWQFQALNEKP